jgi:hypothetical protein
MKKICMGAFIALALVGCGSDSPPGATVAMDVTLPDSPLVAMQKVALLRAGDSFTLAGYENGQVRWGRLSLAGLLTQEANFALAQPVVGPVFAATKKTTPGDQLIAIAVTKSTTTTAAYDLTAIVQTLGNTTAAAPIVLATFPVGTDPTSIQLTAGAATSGNVGFIAWGTRVLGITPTYLLLPADAITAAAPSKLFDDSIPSQVPNWDCLTTLNGTTGLGFGVVTPDESLDNSSNLHTIEIDEAGGNAIMTYQFIVGIANCQVFTSPASGGAYFMAFETNSSIDFATYYPSIDPTLSGTVTTYDPVLPSSLYGGPLKMPHPAWVSPAGKDISIGLMRESGPEVVRFSYNAIPRGSNLSLRSVSGKAGPVVSWVGPNGVYITYTDKVTGTTGANLTKRYFMKVESPAELP